MNYQIKVFLDIVKNQGQGVFWEVDAKTGEFIGEIYYPKKRRGFEKSCIKLEQLFDEGWELVEATNHGWFDNGGQGVDLLIANKKAIKRVGFKQENLTNETILYSAMFWRDYIRFPEDYTLFSSGPY